MATRSKPPRRPSMSPHQGQGRELGLDSRDIPGGLEHLSNPETPSAKPAVPARQHLPSMNEHGVPDDNPDAPHEQPEAGDVLIPEPVPESREYYAVPVYMVSEPGKVGRVRRDVIADRIPVPADTDPPVRVCARDDNRVTVSLLCDDAANDVRIAHNQATLIEGGGAFLSHSATGYLHLPAQGEIWALSTASSLSHLSYVLVTELTG